VPALNPHPAIEFAAEAALDDDSKSVTAGHQTFHACDASDWRAEP